MRNLTAKQKELLKLWRKRDNVYKAEDLTLEQWDRLERINDTEMLYRNVNAFLWDLE